MCRRRQPKIGPDTIGIKCILREMRMFTRALRAARLTRLTSASKKQLLGSLSPTMWELAVLTPIMPPLSPEEVSKKHLKQSAVMSSCRHCTAASGGDVKLFRCVRCMAVCYCSKACQTADWKVRHKVECKGSVSATTTEATMDRSPACSEVSLS